MSVIGNPLLAALVIALAAVTAVWAVFYDPVDALGRIVLFAFIGLVVFAIIARGSPIGQVIGAIAGWLVTVAFGVWLVRVMAG